MAIRVSKGRRTAAAGMIVALTVTLVPAPTSAQPKSIWGRTGVTVPERTDAGNWHGTWFYASKRRKMAFWFREDGNDIQVRLRVEDSSRHRDSFITDWDGKASYRWRGIPGTFSLDFDQKDHDTLSGKWNWKVGDETNGRFETADFTIYRTGHGRQLVMIVENLDRTFHSDDVQKTHQDIVAWTFQKASRRQALWAELPF